LALRRGFKAEAERIATETWEAMNLEPGDRMDGVALAKHLGCSVHSASELVDIRDLQRLYDLQKNAFFACTFKFAGKRPAVVYNPLMDEPRRNSDVAHEAAHLCLDHQLSRLKRVGGVAFLSCDKTQEEEASWLAGCLLLPRFALMHDLKRRLSQKNISEKRVLSTDMVAYRIRVTGAARQFRS